MAVAKQSHAHNGARRHAATGMDVNANATHVPEASARTPKIATRAATGRHGLENVTHQAFRATTRDHNAVVGHTSVECCAEANAPPSIRYS